MPPVPTFDLRLIESKAIAPQVREFTFERVDGEPLEFVAGQWLSLLLPLPDGEVRRAYSIASPPDGTPRCALAITYVAEGQGSKFLHQLEVGATLRAIGPQGFFTRPTDRKGSSLFIATGTGLTPLRSMILDAAARGDTSPMTLLFGVRTAADLIYRDEFDALAKKHAHFRVLYTLSQGADDWPGARGYVQLHARALWEELAKTGSEPHAYICGLHKMVGAIRDLLRKEMNVPREQVHSERYD